MAEGETLAGLLSEVTARHADLPALIERDGERLESITFAELSVAAASLAGELRARGVVRGDVVGVWLPNWFEMVVWEFALASLGAAMLGINTRYGVHELTHLLERGDPVGIVAPARFLDLDFAGRLRRAAGSSSTARTPWVAVVRGASADASEYDIGGGTWTPAGIGEIRTGRDPLPQDGLAADPVNYFTTSGSTGMPKLAGHDQAGVVAHSSAVARAFDMRPGDRFLGVLPLSGVFGFNPTLAMLSVGGATVLEPVFDPGRVLTDMEELAVTHFAGGDDMLGRLMDAWRALDGSDRPALGRLHRGGIADFGGRVEAVVDWAGRELGVPVSGLYGSSELFALTSVWPPELTPKDRRRAGGKLVADALSVRAADPKTGSICEANAVGELQFRGYNVVCGYLGDAQAADAAFTEDGWFRSGDLGYLVEEPSSFVYLCRAGDALRLRGFLVEPAEIEQFLCSHPEVGAAKVVGVPSAEGADVAIAYVQLMHGSTISSEALVAFCRDQLAPFKVPAYINVIDEFPVTTGTNGTKIRTAELRRWAQEQLAGYSPGTGAPAGTPRR